MLEDGAIDIERLAFVSTVILAGLTFWLAPRLPMTDLPQHAAQVAIWHDLLLGQSKWQPILYVNYFTPYLLGYGSALLLSFVLPVAIALKLVLALAYYGFVAACVALRRQLGSDRRLDWLFIPSFFGFAYAWGFYTFLVAAPIGVLFILVAHRYAVRPAVSSGVALALAGIVLFFAHGLVFLLGCLIGGVFLLLRCRLARLLPAALPYVALGLWCLIYAVVRLRLETNPADTPLGVFWGWDLSRLALLIYAVGRPEGPADADWALTPLLLLMLVAPLVLAARPNRRNLTAFVPLAATLVFAAILPDVMMNSSLAYQRFALFALPFYALMFRAPDPPASGGTVRRLWLPVLCWAILAVHAERLVAFTRESASFDEVLAATRPQQRALGLVFDQASAAAGSPDVYVHFPLWYQVEKAGLVDFNFAGYLPQVVRYRPDREPAMFKAGSWWLFRPADRFDWTRDQAAAYRYFFVRRAGPLPAGYFPAGRCAPVPLKSAGNWSVFENVNCHEAADATRCRLGWGRATPVARQSLPDRISMTWRATGVARPQPTACAACASRSAGDVSVPTHDACASCASAAVRGRGRRSARHR